MSVLWRPVVKDEIRGLLDSVDFALQSNLVGHTEESDDAGDMVKMVPESFVVLMFVSLR
jgi:hypothetical protein